MHDPAFTPHPTSQFNDMAGLAGEHHGAVGESLTALPKVVPAHKLVRLEEIEASRRADYQKITRHSQREAFRAAFEEALGEHRGIFLDCARALQDDGIILFRNICDTPNFSRLVAAYDCLMAEANHSSLGHSFLNLRPHSPFVQSAEFQEALCNPLLLAIISYGLGEPIRLVDTRAKDTAPTLTTDRDNGLHVDDSPYNDEFKIHLSWETGTGRGPQGQNLLAIPGSHHLVRLHGTEHGANFKSAFEIVHHILNNPRIRDRISVVEAEDSAPLTVLFEAGALAHQRYRTDQKSSTRSCIILAFHGDDPHLPPYVNSFAPEVSPLGRYVLGDRSRNFLELIAEAREAIAAKITGMRTAHAVIPLHEKRLSKAQILDWLMTIERTPHAEERKPRLVANDSQLSPAELIDKVLEIIDFDKHIDLDLSIYPDRHERVRKEIRNRIRERGIDLIKARAATMNRLSKAISVCLDNQESALPHSGVSVELLLVLNTVIDNPRPGLSPQLQQDFVGLRQLVLDLEIAMRQSQSPQLQRSNLLFLYWCFDEALASIGASSVSVDPAAMDNLERTAQELLGQYMRLVWKEDLQYVPPRRDLTEIRNSLEAVLAQLPVCSVSLNS